MQLPPRAQSGALVVCALLSEHDLRRLRGHVIHLDVIQGWAWPLCQRPTKQPMFHRGARRRARPMRCRGGQSRSAAGHRSHPSLSTTLSSLTFNSLFSVIGAASLQWRIGHKHRSFINPEVTARPTATKRSSNDRQHFRVRRVTPWADVGGGDADVRPSFHASGECKALATQMAHAYCQFDSFCAVFLLGVGSTADSRAVLGIRQRVRNPARRFSSTTTICWSLQRRGCERSFEGSPFSS